jgi:hypothetical protein
MPHHTELFGGAMSCALPDGFADCSKFRDVPDNQEMFYSDGTGACIIVELMQRQRHVGNADCGAFFFADLADANKSQQTRVYPMTTSEAGSLQEDLQLERDLPLVAAAPPAVDAFAAFVHGQQLLTRRVSGADVLGDVYVCLGVLRLVPPISTEILVSVSSPLSHSAAPEGTSPMTTGECAAIARSLLASLDIHDFGLFVPEE